MKSDDIGQNSKFEKKKKKRTAEYDDKKKCTNNLFINNNVKYKWIHVHKLGKVK